MFHFSKRRLLTVAALTILTCSVAGSLGPRVRAAAAPAPAPPPEEQLRDSIRAFASVFHLVEENYADPINADTAIFTGAIPGMLHKLDPHSQFFDPEQFSGLREEQQGHYAGVGMQVAPRNRHTVVLVPFPNTPAYRAGIKPGDSILKVDDQSTEALNTTEVAKRLRGEKGTTVRIRLEREGRDKPFDVSVVRDEIPRKSISLAFFLRSQVGYIKIDTFSETTGRELNEQLKKLHEENLRGLVLDLRDNRGGLLSEGVAVSDKFLKKGQVIVSHGGRASADKPYKATHGNGGRNYPMVVLVNCESASASEIVAGALQDHDRALIAGASTFGKGLVQTEYPLNQNAGLLLTTARYYTPSGRLIQRSYSDVTLQQYYSAPCRGEHPATKLEAKMTDSGRTVYGGDGITPDVRFDPHTLDRFQTELFRRGAFFTYTQHYFASHETLSRTWNPDAAALDDFRKYLSNQKIAFSEAEFTRNTDFIKRYLKREMFIYSFDLDEGEKAKAENDPDILAALDLLPRARELAENAQRLMAQRGKR